MKKLFDRKTLFILSIFIIAGYILRTLYLDKLAMTFGYDQARDSFIIQDIINGDFKIQGPSANAPGLYHGVFYFYFLVIPYILGNGSPIAANIWLAIFNTLTIFVVYILSFSLTKDKKASILASLFFAVSFEISQYATWLSNPSMAIWFVPLTYLFLWFWTNRKKNLFAILTGLFLGLSIQSDLFLIYHIVAIFIWLYLNKKNINLIQIVFSLVGLLIGVSTLVLSEIKFGFQGIHGLIYLFGGGDSIVKSKELTDFILIYVNQIGRLFSLNLLPFSLGFGGALGIAMIYWLVKSKNNYKMFLLLFLFSHLPIISLGGLTSPYLTVGIGVAVCVLAGIFISNLYKNNKIFAVILILIILSSNLVKIFSENKKGQTIFSTRPEMLLSSLVNVIEYTYKSSNGEKFSIDTVTAPLWLNTTWSSVYNWHGLKTYGFLPYWHGRDQVGYWGDNLSKTPKNVSLYYFIIEPHGGIPDNFLQYAINDENSKSKIIEEKDFGGITVQKRLKI